VFDLKTFGLFVATAIAEIIGCYLPYLWLKKDAPVWVLVPAAASLALFRSLSAASMRAEDTFRWKRPEISVRSKSHA